MSFETLCYKLNLLGFGYISNEFTIDSLFLATSNSQHEAIFIMVSVRKVKRKYLWKNVWKSLQKKQAKSLIKSLTL